MMTYGSGYDEVTVAAVPDECPICHHAVEPIYVTHHPKRDWDDKPLYIVFACPRARCGQVFIGYYGARVAPHRQSQYPPLLGCLPSVPKTPDVPESVAAVSPRFVDIYTQAEAARSFKLDEVAGGAYRKALEVLVKDYLVITNTRGEDAVNKMTLADAIAALPDEVMKNMSRFTNLLGSDETHYYRKWENKDIDDVKKYLIATMRAFELYLLHEEGKIEFGLPKFGNKKK